MRRAANNRGYTIVEVMLFLAVSGFMFLLAANFVNGKQQKAEFRQGMNAINSQVRAVINDVNNGYFPSNGDFGCSAGSTGPPGLSSPKGQGENQGCVFLGKIVQFKPGADDPAYTVYGVAGRQYVTTAEAGALPTSFSQAKPIIMPALTEQRTLDWGLKVTKATSGGHNISGIGFFSSFGRYGANVAGEQQLDSGAQNVVVVPVTGTTPPTIEPEITDTNVQSNPNIVICFDGGAGQYGTLTIGGNNGQRLSTAIKISNSPAGCP